MKKKSNNIHKEYIGTKNGISYTLDIKNYIESPITKMVFDTVRGLVESDVMTIDEAIEKFSFLSDNTKQNNRLLKQQGKQTSIINRLKRQLTKKLFNKNS